MWLLNEMLRRLVQQGELDRIANAGAIGHLRTPRCPGDFEAPPEWHRAAAE